MKIKSRTELFNSLVDKILKLTCKYELDLSNKDIRLALDLISASYKPKVKK